MPVEGRDLLPAEQQQSGKREQQPAKIMVIAHGGVIGHRHKVEAGPLRRLSHLDNLAGGTLAAGVVQAESVTAPGMGVKLPLIPAGSRFQRLGAGNDKPGACFWVETE